MRDGLPLPFNHMISLYTTARRARYGLPGDMISNTTLVSTVMSNPDRECSKRPISVLAVRALVPLLYTGPENSCHH
ncbi:hypothetical protein YC2023_089929 [Brassica napus]